MIVVTAQDFFDSRIMDAIRQRLTVISTGRQFNCEVSGNDVTFEPAVSLHLVVVCDVLCFLLVRDLNGFDSFAESV